MTCPHCFHPFENLQSVRPEEQPEDGSLLLCGACGYVSIVMLVDGKQTCREITKEEYNRMHPQDKNDLYFAIRAVIAKQKQNQPAIIVPSWYNPNRQ